MSILVQKLSQGEHPAEVSLQPERTLQALKQRIDRGYIHVKFTETQGGTELGIRLDRSASQLDADFEKGSGELRLVGDLTLDYVKVRCTVRIDLATFSGKGHLTPLQQITL